MKCIKEKLSFLYQRNRGRLEKRIPFILSVVVFVLSIFANNYLSKNKLVIDNEIINNLLSAAITFSSITIGFVGTLLGLLISIEDKPIVKKVHAYRRDYPNYFFSSIMSGAFVILISMLLYLIDIIKTLFSSIMVEVIFSFWLALFIYNLLTAVRISYTMAVLLFNEENKDGEKNAEDKKNIEDFRDKHSK